MIELLYFIKRLWKLGTGQYLTFKDDYSPAWNRKFWADVAKEEEKIRRELDERGGLVRK